MRCCCLTLSRECSSQHSIRTNPRNTWECEAGCCFTHSCDHCCLVLSGAQPSQAVAMDGTLTHSTLTRLVCQHSSMTPLRTFVQDRRCLQHSTGSAGQPAQQCHMQQGAGQHTAACCCCCCLGCRTHTDGSAALHVLSTGALSSCKRFRRAPSGAPAVQAHCQLQLARCCAHCARNTTHQNKWGLRLAA
jgi:hypothetical protein